MGNLRTAANWVDSEHEAKEILIACAKKGDHIFYSELAKKLTAVKVDAHDPSLFTMLDQISREEAARRGMLSVLVVHKIDYLPGPGFFNLAKQLGREFMQDEPGRTAFAIIERRNVHKAYDFAF